MASTDDFDVIVIGAGGAGLAAAVTAADAGARVLLVESDRKAGGSTALSGGVFYAAGTSLQRACGIDDTAESLFRYYMNVNQHKLEAAVVRRLCFDAAPTFEWLVSLGVAFPAANLYCSGVDMIRRGHRAKGHGAEIAAALEGALAGKRVDLAVNTRVRRLLTRDGAVVGIEADGEAVTAAATIVTTGGFGNNRQMLAELYPTAARQGDLAWYIGSSHCLGDGIAMGRAIGADLAGLDRGLLLMTPGFEKELEPYLPPWLLHINHEGRRFINEATEYSVLAEVLLSQTAGECFAVFDEAARASSRSGTAPNWSADRLAHFANAGKLVRSETLTGLAATLGLRAETLQTTADTVSRDADAGHDSQFFKPPEYLRPLRTPPFYGARIRPAVVCWTGTGLRIDAEARVLDKADRPLQGLFAAGETTGGMFGQCYAGGGASIGNALVYGRIAGRNAALARR